MTGDNIFPVLNRRAPLLERIRGEDEQNELVDSVSSLVSDSVKSDDEEMIEETKQTISESLNVEIANNLGVDASDISDDFINGLTDMLVGSDESDILTKDAQKSLGIKVENDGEDSEDKDSGELFDK